MSDVMDDMEIEATNEELAEIEQDLAFGGDLILQKEIDTRTFSSALEYYLSVALKSPLLTEEEEKKLSYLEKKGDRKAWSRLIMSNTRLVVNIASANHVDDRVDLIDLISAGNFGLFKAISKFEPERGFRFSTYATWWIAQAIQRHNKNNARNVRIPIHIMDRLGRYKKLLRERSQTGLKFPTIEEMQELMGLSEIKCRELLLIVTSELSLDAPIEDWRGDGFSIGDTLPCEVYENCEVDSHKRALYKTVNKIMEEILSPREREILRLRFDKGLTLSDVASYIQSDVHPERVRQIETRSLDKLRHRLSMMDVSWDDVTLESQ
jgi:RNA polymerase primary sigma factor